MKHIFYYLHGIEELQLTFGLDKPIEVEGFMDSDYTGNPDNRKSTLGYVFNYGGSMEVEATRMYESLNNRG